MESSANFDDGASRKAPARNFAVYAVATVAALVAFVALMIADAPAAPKPAVESTSQAPAAITAPTAPSGARVAAADFPDVPVYAATFDGSVIRLGSAGIVGEPLLVCPGRPVNLLAGSPRSSSLVAICAQGAAGGQTFLIDPKARSVRDLGIPGLPRLDAAVWSPDGTQFAVLASASCAGNNQCGNRVLLVENGVAREILTGGVGIGDLRWTTLGPTITGPLTKGQPGGTYRWTGSDWTWLSPDQLIAASATAQVFRRVERGPTQERSMIVLRTGERETVLTPATADEWPVAILDDGAVAGWRLGQGTSGEFVRYDRNGNMRLTPGEFAPRAEFTATWFLAADFSGKVHAYSTERDAFATWMGQTTQPITDIAVSGQ